ncbi:hypothetical protein M433DRAFT_155175 [Acidomyces richmondensis BFW]|nr:MAG: hypothetical protein FE78DRAFT_91823 [Acidomyces sp. 'richmondensis']KYG44818.1 hypothetical protein M433DRAFT_155175 [Acidomyces richmondensis BFW]
MPGIKRPFVETEDHHVHPSRKQRLESGEVDLRLAEFYNDLADDMQEVRYRAAMSIVQALTVTSPHQVHRIDKSLTRLIKGVCSGRQSARLGFSVALAEVLHVAFSLAYNSEAEEFRLEVVTQKVLRLTEPDKKASGQEQRDHLIGRRFAFQAILQSNVASIRSLPDVEWKGFLVAVCDFAGHKDWLRGECGAMLWEFLVSPNGASLTPERIRSIVNVMHEAKLLKTLEGVAIWLLVGDRCPEALPSGVWHKKNPFSSDERQVLKKIFLGGSLSQDMSGKTPGTRQSQASFAWQPILSHLYKHGKDFRRTWEDVVENGFLADSASTERKALGLQVVSTAVSTAPESLLPEVLSRRLAIILKNQRADPNRYLFASAKVVLDGVVLRTKTHPDVGATLLNALLATGAFDQKTKTKTVETMLQSCKPEKLDSLISIIRANIVVPSTEDDTNADTRRRVLADMLLSLVKSRRDQNDLFQLVDARNSDENGLKPWLAQVLSTMVLFGYCTFPETPTPEFSTSSREVFRARLISCLGYLMERLPANAINATTYVANLLEESRKRLQKPLNKQSRDAVKSAHATRKEIMRTQSYLDNTVQAYRMLFDLTLLLVYNEEPESVEVLQDLEASYHAQKAGSNSSVMLMELLLSFASRSITLFRKLTEHAFAAFAPLMSSESMQSIFNILEQKEGMSGQQELFEQHDRDTAVIAIGESNEDSGAIDADDLSDVELVDGDVGSVSEVSDSSCESEDEPEKGSEADQDAEDDDEVAAFNKKLAETLGSAAMNTSADEDDSDMDDDQMMVVDAQLANVFREQKKAASKKQENKDAKATIVNFKNRVLDLLMIYVKSQYSNLLALDIILPLTELVRTTSSKQTAEKAFGVLKQYFEACNKHKDLPQPNNVRSVFNMLEAIHGKMRLGGSKLFAACCSRSALFLSKVLVNLDEKNYEAIAIMYARLQSEWHRDAKSKIHRSIFTDWTSWSLATQKQV